MYSAILGSLGSKMKFAAKFYVLLQDFSQYSCFMPRLLFTEF